jgi:hypothetical protein
MRTARMRLPAVIVLVGAWTATAQGAGLPLPKAPVRILIRDVAAFDAALTGSYRRALTGEPEEDDPVVTAWLRTPVGSKLEAQWGKLAPDLPWSFADIVKLKPRAVGVALLSAGSLEFVLVIDTPAAMAVPLPAGTSRKTPAGVAYTVVARGAGDDAQGDRRLGLAWARADSRWILATSERALVGALEESAAGRGFEPSLTGIVSMELDLDALHKDRYFKREFLFDASGDAGHVAAALRIERGRLVEVREGGGESHGDALAFDAPGAVAAAWEPEGATLWPALRAALLEPRPDLAARPVPALRPLPAAHASESEDRYLVDLRKPQAGPGAPAEEGDLALWRELAARQPVPGWGYSVAANGTRRLVFDWPAGLMPDLERACRSTLERRAGRIVVETVGDAHEFRMGAGLPGLAWKRVGSLVWIGPSAAALADLPDVRREPDVVRWGRLDLGAVRAESIRWNRAEGPASPESVRPFSDRILGLLGWMPATTSLSVERRKAPGGWTERIEFGTRSAP